MRDNYCFPWRHREASKRLVLDESSFPEVAFQPHHTRYTPEPLKGAAVKLPVSLQAISELSTWRHCLRAGLGENHQNFSFPTTKYVGTVE